MHAPYLADVIKLRGKSCKMGGLFISSYPRRLRLSILLIDFVGRRSIETVDRHTMS